MPKMPSTNGCLALKDLHMATNIVELNRQAELPPSINKHKAEMLVSAAKKLLVKAEKFDGADEEGAYVFYMKYVNVVMRVRKCPEYKSDGKYFDLMLGGGSCMKKAVESMERLQKRLRERYNDAQLQMRITPTPSNDGRVTPAQEPSNGVVPETIDPKEFYRVMAEKSTSFFMLDARPREDYHQCRIKHPHVINVPRDCLNPGVTASKIEKAIHIEERSQWSRRTTADILVVFDWTSERFEESTHLMALRDAMIKWDLETDYRSNPRILKGGIENFAQHYPFNVTNPEKARNPPANCRHRNSSKGVKNALSQLNDLEYPDLDAAFIGTPSPSGSPNVSSSSSSTTLLNPSSSSTLYPSSNDLSELNRAFVSGAITVVKETPVVPSRSTKPTSATASSPAPSLARLPVSASTPARGSTAARTPVPSSADTVRELLNNPPKIDRSLKAKLLLKKDKVEVGQVHEAESDLVDESLELERKQLELEKRWEVLRLRREKEAEEEMKLEVMKKEELLLEEIKKMAEEKLKRDEENGELKLQLERMRMELERQRKESDKEREARESIEAKERERTRLKEEVERKRKERIKKQRDQKELEERMRKLKESEAKRLQVEMEVAEKERLMKGVTKVKLKDEGESSFSGGLNRSHSSPNIAKMLEDEDADAVVGLKQPPINRLKKPAWAAGSSGGGEESSAVWQKAMARYRDFQPVLGTGKRCLTGLKNLGNTCYMNSILQSLSSFSMPANYFLNRDFLSRDLNAESSTQGAVVIEYAEVLRNLRSGQYNSIVPADFKSVIGRFDSKFRTYDQQDAHELLNKMMEWMHDDLNECKKGLKVPEQKNEGVPEPKAAETAWDMDSTVDKSFVRETFYGQWRSVLTCLSCGWESVKYEPFFELALQLPPGNGRCSLRQCIEGFLKPEQVNYRCPKCERSRECEKKFEIVRLPSIIIIQLVRFYNDGLSRKRQNLVDFELSNLNLGQYVKACGGKLNRYHNYNLYSVCNHMGSMEGGHYTAFCYHGGQTGRWYKFDDHEVSDISASDVKSPKAYILFYSALQH